jgi:hypothetical protein
VHIEQADELRSYERKKIKLSRDSSIMTAAVRETREFEESWRQFQITTVKATNPVKAFVFSAAANSPSLGRLMDLKSSLKEPLWRSEDRMTQFKRACKLSLHVHNWHTLTSVASSLAEERSKSRANKTVKANEDKRLLEDFSKELCKLL